jgi:hypothetical protein
MTFKLTQAQLSAAYVIGKRFAADVAPMIQAADEARKPAVLEAASDRLRGALETVTAGLITAGATPADLVEYSEHCRCGYSDALVSILNP